MQNHSTVKRSPFAKEFFFFNFTDKTRKADVSPLRPFRIFVNRKFNNEDMNFYQKLCFQVILVHNICRNCDDKQMQLSTFGPWRVPNNMAYNTFSLFQRWLKYGHFFKNDTGLKIWKPKLNIIWRLKHVFFTNLSFSIQFCRQISISHYRKGPKAKPSKETQGSWVSEWRLNIDLFWIFHHHFYIVGPLWH